MFGRLVFAAVFEADDRVSPERHEVGQQKSVRRFDLVLVISRFQLIARAHRMARKRQFLRRGENAEAGVCPVLRRVDEHRL